MKKAPIEGEAGAEPFSLRSLPETCVPTPASFISLLTPPRDTGRLPPVCAQGPAEIFQSEPYSGQERSLKGNFSGNPNICTIYLLNVLHRSSQFIIFGTKTCVLYNLICLLNYQVCYILEKNKQTALAGVAQLLGASPCDWRTIGSIPSPSTYDLVNASLLHQRFSLSHPLPLETMKESVLGWGWEGRKKGKKKGNKGRKERET